MHEDNNTFPISERIRDYLNSGFPRDRLPLDIGLGLINGFMEAFFALSLASLIFSGPLNPELNVGISIALSVAVITLLFSALFSSTKIGVGALQDGPNVIIAIMVGSLAQSSVYIDSEELLATALAAMFVSTFGTGAVLFLVGVLKQGKLVRYIPFPVVGGFLAGTGWLLVNGSFQILTSTSISFSNLPKLLSSDQMILWIPAMLAAIVLLVGLQRIRHFFAMPGILLALLLAFYLVLGIAGISLDQAREMGLLLGGGMEIGWVTPDLRHIADANFPELFGEAGNIAIVIGISLIGVMLNTTSIELGTRKDFDIDHELRVAGLGNILASAAVGTIGFISVSLSLLNHRTGSRSRIPGVVAAIVVGLVAWLGFSVLELLPKMVVGGLLLFLGFDFLNEWLVQAWKRFTLVEYGIVLMIVVVIAISDFIIGVAVGLTAMIIMFVVSYSRISVVKHALSGADIQSNLERNAIDRRTLVKHGETIYILELRGFLFFGTAYSMLNLIRDRLEDTSASTVRFILVDFMNVTGLDTSAVLSFLKTEQLSRTYQVTLGLCGMSNQQLDMLELGGMVQDHDLVRFFPDVDRGLEWCEERILTITEGAEVSLSESLHDQLCDLGFDERLVSKLCTYLEPVNLKVGDYLIHQGESAESLYYVESGRVSVYLEREGGERIRLRTITSGTTVGEMGLYTDAERTADVIAEEPTRAHRLTKGGLERMAEHDPEVANGFNRWIAQLLSERLALATKTIEALHPR